MYNTCTVISRDHYNIDTQINIVDRGWKI